jgi:hypothetical protein
MRTTTLTCFQRRKQAGSDADERLKEFRKQSENGPNHQNFRCKVQIEVLVVTILACMVSALVTGKYEDKWMDRYEQRVEPTNTRLLTRQITCCTVRTMGTLTHSIIPLHKLREVTHRSATYLHRRSGCNR